MNLRDFGDLTDEELACLWEALALDDGIHYWPEPGSVEERLLASVEHEMNYKRNLACPRHDGWTYEPA